MAEIVSPVCRCAARSPPSRDSEGHRDDDGRGDAAGVGELVGGVALEELAERLPHPLRTRPPLSPDGAGAVDGVLVLRRRDREQRGAQHRRVVGGDREPAVGLAVPVVGHRQPGRGARGGLLALQPRGLGGVGLLGGRDLDQPLRQTPQGDRVVLVRLLEEELLRLRPGSRRRPGQRADRRPRRRSPAPGPGGSDPPPTRPGHRRGGRCRAPAPTASIGASPDGSAGTGAPTSSRCSSHRPRHRPRRCGRGLRPATGAPAAGRSQHPGPARRHPPRPRSATTPAHRRPRRGPRATHATAAATGWPDRGWRGASMDLLNHRPPTVRSRRFPRSERLWTTDQQRSRRLTVASAPGPGSPAPDGAGAPVRSRCGCARPPR